MAGEFLLLSIGGMLLFFFDLRRLRRIEASSPADLGAIRLRLVISKAGFVLSVLTFVAGIAPVVLRLISD